MDHEWKHSMWEDGELWSFPWLRNMQTAAEEGELTFMEELEV